MVSQMDTESPVYDICMGGFVLKNTLSDNGAVTRGVCQVEDGVLKKVEETYEIRMEGGKVLGRNEQGNQVEISPGQPVSMNMWGLPVKFLEVLREGFPKFLDQIEEGNLKAEYLLPAVIDELVQTGKARVKVLDTPDKWFGVTYKEDKQAVVDAIRGLIDAGVYKEHLFE